MKNWCIEMNTNKNCIFVKMECLKIIKPVPPEKKPCLNCDIYYDYWDVKKREIAQRKQLLDDMY
ncbi:unnamed protein product, partial [marine sediment metagenome]